MNLSNEQTLNYAKSLVTDYLIKEYDKSDIDDITDIKLVNYIESKYLATITATLDLTHYAVKTYINGVVVKEIYYSSLDNLIAKQLENLNYDELSKVTQKEWDCYIICVLEDINDSITTDDMNTYGYHWIGMYPLNYKAAQNFYGIFDIYLLYPDDTEALVENLGDLWEHYKKGGIFGVEQTDIKYYLDKNKDSRNLKKGE